VITILPVFYVLTYVCLDLIYLPNEGENYYSFIPRSLPQDKAGLPLTFLVHSRRTRPGSR
jgi:hypothetical protein